MTPDDSHSLSVRVDHDEVAGAVRVNKNTTHLVTELKKIGLVGLAKTNCRTILSYAKFGRVSFCVNSFFLLRRVQKYQNK